METRLTIIWDGSAPGLAQHRLSLAHFGPSLNLLLRAMRRIASNILTQVPDPGDIGLRGGRLSTLARQIDLEIVQVEEGSLELTLACVLHMAPGQNMQLLDRLPDQACAEFISAVEQESAGQPRHGLVREYLRSLPEGVSSQRYVLSDSSGKVRVVQVGHMDLPTLPAIAPSLVDLEAHVIGVGFEPGRLEVRLHKEGARPLICSATQALVDRAIDLRNKPVRALLVNHAGRLRLLRLLPVGEADPMLTNDAREALIWDRWDELLRRFAQ